MLRSCEAMKPFKYYESDWAKFLPCDVVMTREESLLKTHPRLQTYCKRKHKRFIRIFKKKGITHYTRTVYIITQKTI